MNDKLASQRTSLDPSHIEQSVLDHLYYTCCKDLSTATPLDVFRAIASATRDRMVQRWLATRKTYIEKSPKRVYYFSAEFLIGRLLAHNLINLGLYDLAAEKLKQYDIDLEHVLEEELDPGLGNGGLGRLAACFMDSLASLELPAMGYGIRYEFGIFDQLISDGWQVERGDDWLRRGNPWEIARHEYTVPVQFFGRVETRTDARGHKTTHWVDAQTVLGVPYDMPVLGYENNTVNTLRLWSARASREFNFQVFNDGDYRHAVEEKALTESISKVLYPNDQSAEGRELRLKQQYFFVACSIADVIRRFKRGHGDFDRLPEEAAIQLNDTHPAVAVAELMRVLVDQEGLQWERAWTITQTTIAYTNHTLLPEALETWDLQLFERLLPRHMQIIFEINRRFLLEVHVKWPGNDQVKRDLSIIQESTPKRVRMAHLAVVGSHSVNGVAELHSQLIREQLMPEFFALWPDRFNNKTNGVTPRRWLMQANPKLSALFTERLGEAWKHDLDALRGLTAFAQDPELHTALRAIKLENKAKLARIIHERHGFAPDLDSIFDVQVKRLHEYKRQLLNCLQIVSSYLELKANPDKEVVPRTYIFGGKAAPGYAMAKLHIKLINDVAAIVNQDPDVRGRIRVVFLANYNVSLAEIIIPAADVSEQISVAGKEASGTGNMKFAMNGALTVGTLDGANVEIREEVGEDNFFLFGMETAEVKALRSAGYHPEAFIAQSPRLQAAIHAIEQGFFSPDDPARFQPVAWDLRRNDQYMICADFEDYLRCHAEVADVYQAPDEWMKRVVHNLANVGKFSSDRTIAQYAAEIWDIKPTPIKL
ncbi:MAG: glycogen/starch/alpha-glucan phosphorylase [bacterium]